jgi:hypothetical protein
MIVRDKMARKEAETAKAKAMAQETAKITVKKTTKKQDETIIEQWNH